MTATNPLLTRRAVLQIAIESAYRTEAAVGANDAIYVEDPNYELDINVLERNFARDDLSPLATIVGRRLASMTFTTELKSNGNPLTGNASQAALITRLFRASGYSMTEMPGPGVSTVFTVGVHNNLVEWEQSSGDPATDTLTIDDVPTADEEVVIGDITYIWKAAPANPYEVDIGADASSSAANLRAAINGGAGSGTAYGAGTVAHPDVVATGAGGSVIVTANYPGTWGNSIVATTDMATAGDWGGAGVLAGGANAASNTDVIAYHLEVTTGGASGVAQITVTSDTEGEGNAAAAVTTGTPFTVGSKGLTLTPTFTGNLVQGQKWTLWLLPAGLKLDPVSDDFESLTMVLNMDGVEHKMLGSFGTFTITAEAGDYARVEWEFQGTFEETVDAELPICNYETSLPHQVELARLRVENFYAIVNALNYTQGNDIQIRPDVSSAEGYIGTRIVARTPEGGIDPEAELVASHDFWGKMGAATRMPFQMRIGIEPGNTIWFLAPSTQYTGLTYQDRNGIRTYDASLRFSRVFGNDEVSFFFC